MTIDMTIEQKLTTIAENLEKIYAAGAGGAGAAQGKPYVDTSKGVRHHEYLFAANRWIDQLDRFDLSNITSAAYMFQNCGELITAPAVNTSKAQRMLYMFYNCPKLVTIEGVDFSSCTNASNAFYNDYRLQTIVINGTIPCTIDFGTCRALSGETIRDIMNALSADGTGKTITISQTALNAAFTAGGDNPFTADEWEVLKSTAQGNNWSVALA